MRHFLFSFSVDQKILKKRRKNRVTFAITNDLPPFHLPLPANQRVTFFVLNLLSVFQNMYYAKCF